MATKEFHWVASKREMEYDDVRCEVAGSCIVHMYRVSIVGGYTVYPAAPCTVVGATR